MVEAGLTEDEAFEVLGLAPGAEPEQVDAAHRRLASRAHPDRWIGADLDEQEAVRVRFEEVNEAHRVLKAGRKAGLGPPGSRPSPSPRRRSAPASTEASHRAPAPVVVEATTSSSGTVASVTVLPDVEDDPQHKVPPGLVVAVAAVAAVMVVLAAIGLSSPSADGSRQRSVLGPLAHRLWEAESRGDHGVMWDVAEDAFKASVDRTSFVNRLDACPRRRPPREVARMDSVRGGLWEVESVDPSGVSGVSLFRQEDSYRFGAVFDDPDLRDLLSAPVDAAPNQRWCQRP